jgi:hypothetical protein
MEEFNYNFDLSHEVNFDKWRRASDTERRTYKEKPYSDTEAKKIFNNMYKDQSSWRIGTVWEKK